MFPSPNSALDHVRQPVKYLNVFDNLQLSSTDSFIIILLKSCSGILVLLLNLLIFFSLKVAGHVFHKMEIVGTSDSASYFNDDRCKCH